MKKTFLLLLFALGISVWGWGQTTVFSDDFSTNQSDTWTTSGQIGSSAFSVSRSGVDWGARRNTSPAQLELTNDVGATGNVAGWVFAYAATANFSSPYNTTISSNPGLVTWYFNMRQIRTDPAGFASGSYGVAFILGCSGTTPNNAGNGYAVVLGQSLSTDPIRLASFNNGLAGTLTNIITSNTTGLTDFGAEYVSCKVTYNPSNNLWELFLRNDGASAFADPASGTLVSQGTATDNTYTSTALAYMGAYWQGSTGGAQTAFFDNVSITVVGSGGNNPPSISNILQNPTSGITPSTTVSVSADVTDSDGTVAGVELQWGTATGEYTNFIDMSLSVGDTYVTDSDIPAQTAGTTVYYVIYALDDDADETTSAEQSYTVISAEPTSHASGFGATTNSSSAITVTWTDSDASSYLIKGSAVSYAAIVNPVDGVAESDGGLVKNVASTVQTHQFTGLNPSTPYYFKIFPYNGTGATINYKTDGSVPQATATTEAGYSQADYFRTKSGGTWSNMSIWEQSVNGTEWVDASFVPNQNSNTILISTGHVVSVDASLTIDQLTIEGELFIDGNAITLTLNDGTGEDLVVKNGGSLVMAVTGGSGGWSISTGAVWRVENGGTYIHFTTRGISTPMNSLTLDAGSNFVYLGSSTLIPSMAISNRTYQNLSFESISGSWSTNFVAGANPLTVEGTFKVGQGVTWTKGSFTGVVNLNGNSEIYGSFTIDNITIGIGFNCMIQSTGNMTVTGTLTNNGALTVLSDATGTGSLIHSTAGVPATVQRYITAANWGTEDDGWHQISSPVASQLIYPEFVSGYALGNEDFYKWDETTNLWINIKNSDGSDWNEDFETSFVTGRGYFAAYQNTDTKEFTGNLNVSDVTVGSLTLSTGENSGWHLLGNPFTSALTWYTDWTLTNIGGVANIWNRTAKSYSPVNAGDPIPAMNGFLVKVTTADGSVTIPAAKRVHSAQAWYKNSDYPVVRLLAHNLDYPSYQESQVRFNPISSEGFDNEFDGRFLPGYAPRFYSLVDGKKCMVNSMPSLTAETEISFDFILNKGSNFSIEANGLDNLMATAYLNDLKTGTVHNLSQNPVYTFTAAEGDAPNRFKLTFGSVGMAEPASRPLAAYYADGRLYFVNAEGEKTIEIFNMAGQRLIFANPTATEYPVNLTPGIYVVKVTTARQVVSTKFFVK